MLSVSDFSLIENEIREFSNALDLEELIRLESTAQNEVHDF